MKTISFYNIKGGVAKTTSTLAFAQILHNDYGKRVLVFDIDKQANSTKTLGCYDADGLSSADLLVSKKNIVRDVIKHSEYGIDVIPANYNLIKANRMYCTMLSVLSKHDSRLSLRKFRMIMIIVLLIILLKIIWQLSTVLLLLTMCLYQ